VEVQICSNLNLTSVKRVFWGYHHFRKPPYIPYLEDHPMKGEYLGSPQISTHHLQDFVGDPYFGRIGSAQDVTCKWWSDHPHRKKPWSKRPFGRGTSLGEATDHHGLLSTYAPSWDDPTQVLGGLLNKTNDTKPNSRCDCTWFLFCSGGGTKKIQRQIWNLRQPWRSEELGCVCV